MRRPSAVRAVVHRRQRGAIDFAGMGPPRTRRSGRSIPAAASSSAKPAAPLNRHQPLIEQEVRACRRRGIGTSETLAFTAAPVWMFAGIGENWICRQRRRGTKKVGKVERAAPRRIFHVKLLLGLGDNAGRGSTHNSVHDDRARAGRHRKVVKRLLIDQCQRTAPSRSASANTVRWPPGGSARTAPGSGSRRRFLRRPAQEIVNGCHVFTPQWRAKTSCRRSGRCSSRQNLPPTSATKALQ